MPAAIALRGVTAYAFFSFDAFLPLALTSLHHQSPSRAGLSLTAGGVSWATGSWVQERRGARWGRRRTAASGVALILVGMAVSGVVLAPGSPPVFGAAGWLFAGLGMGLCYPITSLVVLAEAPEGRVGKASSALHLCDVLGVAVGTGVSGAALAIAEASGWGTRWGLVMASSFSFAVGLAALLTALRLPAA
jgi:MFS family permease